MTEFKCSVCGRVYESYWWAVKKYRQPDGNVINYIQCPKEGGIAYENEVIQELKIGEGVIGKSIIGQNIPQ